MELTSLNRTKAASLHLLISAVVGIAVVILMLAVWYPRPYFKAMGGELLVLLLIGVDVVIGPLITLIIFKPGKKGLKFDLTVIAALQLAALAYGCHVMFSARPVYNVFVVDRFETVAANQVDEASLAKASGEFGKLPLTGPRVIGARQPTDAARQSEVVVQAMTGGPDLANLPTGCRFAPRCSLAIDACRTYPSETNVGLGHRVNCWRADESLAGSLGAMSAAGAMR